MIHRNKAENLPQENDNSWLGSNLYRLMLIVTIVWFAIVMIYITQFFGWSNLFLMMPDEFGGFLAGVTLPLALIWVGMAYVDRSASFKREAKFLRAYMNQLVYPEEGGSATAQAMSSAIRSQVSELQEVTKLAMTQTAVIKKELDSRVDDFASLVRILDNYSTKSIVELTNGVKTLTKSFDGVAEKAFKTTKDLNGCIAEFSSVASRLQGDISGIADNLLPGMREIKNSADIIQKVAESSSNQITKASENIRSYGDVSEQNFNLVFEKIEAQSEYLKNITDKTVDSTRTLSKTFHDVSLEIDRLVAERGRKAVEYTRDLDTNMQNIYQKIIQHSDKFAAETDKIIAKSTMVEDTISSQANDLRTVSDAIAENLRLTEESIHTNFEEMDRRTSDVIEKIRTVSGEAVNKVTGLNDIVTEQSDSIRRLISDVDERTNQITATMDKHSNKVGEVTQTFSKQFIEIVDTFNEQSTLFKTVADQAVDVSKNLQNQISSIGENTNTIFSKMATLEEEVNRRGSAVADKSNVTINKLSEIDQDITDRLLKFDERIDAIHQRQNEVVKNFSNGIEEFTKYIEEIKDGSVSGAEVVGENAEKIREIHENFMREFTDLSEKMEGYASQIGTSVENIYHHSSEMNSNFDSALEKMITQSSTIKENFTRQREDLTDAVNLVSAQTRLGEASLNQQYKCLMDVSDAISLKVSDLSTKITNDINSLRDNTNKLAEDVATVSERLTQIGTGIGETAETSLTDIDKANQALTDYSAKLSNATDNAATNMNRITEHYQKCLDDFTEVADQTKQALEKTSEVINIQKDKMNNVTNETKTLADYFDGVMNNASDHLIEKANIAHEKIQDVSGDLQRLGGDLEETTTAGTKYFAETGDKLRELLTVITSDSTKIINDIRNSNDTFAEQSATLRATTSTLRSTADETLAKVSEVMGNFSYNLEDFSSKSRAIVENTDNFNGALKKQIELLDIGGKQAGNELADIEKRYREMKVENFLKNATSIIERLETLAVDINVIFNPDTQEKLWQKYYEGDTGVFVRNLSKTMSRKQVIAIKEEFEKNSEFRKMVVAYLGEFEELINRARTCEKSGILLSVISGADIGKIYYVIARALDKLN